MARPTAKAAIEKPGRRVCWTGAPIKLPAWSEPAPHSVRDIYLARAYLENEVLRRLARTGDVPAAAVQANRDIAAVQSGAPLDVVELATPLGISLIDAWWTKNGSAGCTAWGLVGEVRLCTVRIQSLHLLDTALIQAEHQKILELIEAGDGEGAAELLDEHLGRARERLVAVRLILSVRDRAEVFALDALHALARRHANFSYLVTLDARDCRSTRQPAGGTAGFPNGSARSSSTSAASTVLAAGPPGFVEACVATVLRLGASPKQVLTDSFTPTRISPGALRDLSFFFFFF